MKCRIRLFEQAAEEIEEERNWYRQRSESVEASFLREIDHAIEVVLENPQIWPHYMDGTQRYVFPVFPFSLVYFVEGDIVIVVTVEADNKRPGYWRGRLRGRRK